MSIQEPQICKSIWILVSSITQKISTDGLIGLRSRLIIFFKYTKCKVKDVNMRMESLLRKSFNNTSHSGNKVRVLELTVSNCQEIGL